MTKKRFQWGAEHDKVLIARYRKGDSAPDVADAINAKFELRPKLKDHQIQGRLSTLFRTGVLEKRPRSKAAREALAKKVSTKAKPKAVNGHSNGHTAADTRVLSIDLGARGALRLEVSGPIVLNTETMEDLASTFGKLLSA
jgi:hypothetical protein